MTREYLTFIPHKQIMGLVSVLAQRVPVLSPGWSSSFDGSPSRGLAPYNKIMVKLKGSHFGGYHRVPAPGIVGIDVLRDLALRENTSIVLDFMYRNVLERTPGAIRAVHPNPEGLTVRMVAETFERGR